MGGNTFGRLFRITTWGESHGKAVGVVVDGCPSGLPLTERDIEQELERRRGGGVYTTRRSEEDKVEILSGVFEGVTTGTPISMLIWNRDVNSTPYEPLKHVFRPGHADYTYWRKYGIRDWRGGGRASARETVGRVAAGAVAKKLISTLGMKVVGFVKSLGDVEAKQIPKNPEELIKRTEESPLRCPDPLASKRMETLVMELREEGDSIGGVVEVIAFGVPSGLGEPVFEKLEA